MGEVYRARDTRLDRIVAIKVLPSQFASDPQFRKRFDREARTISQLTHPHICTLHDVGEHDHTAFLVMEHLEGETLADRLTKGPLRTDQALHHAIEIAAALEAAHRHGIVHRDLKPGNIMLTKSGVKLLDFGLAKVGTAAVASGAFTTELQTVAPLTAQGTILGTCQYMAPEQLEGKEADPRSDIWAFGCVLYEMIAGRPAFEGKAQVRVMSAILKDEPPPLTQVQPVTPALDYVVRTCLGKNPEDRFQNVHDLRLQLRWIHQVGAPAALPAPVVVQRSRRVHFVWAAAAAIALAVGATSAWWLKPAASVTAVARFDYVLPEGQVFTRWGRHVLAFSRDGSKLGYVANQQLYLRQMNALEAQPIGGTNEDPAEPVFSPDGAWIAYFVPVSAGFAGAGALLKKVSTNGGAPTTLAKVAGVPFGTSWGAGMILFGMNYEGAYGIQAVPEAGGMPRTLVSVNDKTERARQPQLLEDRRHIIFSVPPPLAMHEIGNGEGPIVVQAIGSTDRKMLVPMGLDPRVLPTGHLVYVHNGTLFAVRFDAKRLEVAGDTFPVLEGISQLGSGAAQFAVSENGSLLYARGLAVSTRRQLVAVDRQGTERPLTLAANRYHQPRLSPDRTRLVVAESAQVWMWTFATETLMRLTTNEATHRHPAWMGDSHVVFDSNDGSGIRIMRKSADGAGAEDVLAEAPAGYPNFVTPDRKFLIYYPDERIAMLLPLQPKGVARPLLPDVAGQVSNVELSADGRWIAFESNESGRFEVYVRPFPAVETGRWQISSNGGMHPLWSRDGRELFFIAADGMMMAVPIQGTTGFRHGRPLGLFRAGHYFTFVSRNYDLTPDGKGFIMIKNDATAGERPSIVVVTNWFDEVRAKMRATR